MRSRTSFGLFVPLVLRAMTPEGPFDAEARPAAPDYADDASWSALPGQPDAADEAPAELPAIDQRAAPADVFYVHPTSYVGDRWNGPIDDPKIRAASDRGGALIQASTFNGCCAIYAPYYRQANGTALIRPSADGDRALDLAYGDLVRAFESFLERRGRDRPFLVAAHSQGTVLAERLLAEQIAGTPLQDHLVAAWLPGGNVGAQGITPDLPPCRDSDDLGCVIAWNARRDGHVPNALALANPRGQTLLCTNPLRWDIDGTAAPASANLGAVFLDSDDPRPRPGFASAQCVDGTLIVSEMDRAPRDFMSRLLDRAIGKGNLHPIEYQLFWANIRENAAVRVAAATAP